MKTKRGQAKLQPKKQRKQKYLLRIKLTAEIRNEAGMEQFAKLLRVLYDNGFEPTVKAIVGYLVEEARRRGGVPVPGEISTLGDR